MPWSLAAVPHSIVNPLISQHLLQLHPHPVSSASPVSFFWHSAWKAVKKGSWFFPSSDFCELRVLNWLKRWEIIAKYKNMNLTLKMLPQLLSSLWVAVTILLVSGFHKSEPWFFPGGQAIFSKMEQRCDHRQTCREKEQSWKGSHMCLALAEWAPSSGLGPPGLFSVTFSWQEGDLCSRRKGFHAVKYQKNKKPNNQTFLQSSLPRIQRG